MAFEFGEAAQAMAYFIKAVMCRPASPEDKSEGESFPKESPAALKGLQNKKVLLGIVGGVLGQAGFRRCVDLLLIVSVQRL